MSLMYNLSKDTGVMSWQPSLAGIYLKSVLDGIRCKETLGCVKPRSGITRRCI